MTLSRRKFVATSAPQPRPRSPRRTRLPNGSRARAIRTRRSASSTRASRAIGSHWRVSSRSHRACAGAKGRCGSATAAISYGATFPTTASCAGTRRPAGSACSASRPTSANGNARDRQGRLLTCEHGPRRVTRTEYDGTIKTIAERFEGKPLNSPNDIVCKSDGSIWFTDPPFGVLGYYEGYVARPELPTNVYRVDPASGEITVVTGGGYSIA